MLDQGNLPGWIALFVGIYALAAGIGGLRQPDLWAGMLREFAGSKALRFLTGLVVLALGAIVYLANPWRPDDWLSIVVTVIGGWMVVEGALILAAGDRFIGFFVPVLQSGARIWAIASVALGFLLLIVGLLRV